MNYSFQPISKQFTVWCELPLFGIISVHLCTENDFPVKGLHDKYKKPDFLSRNHLVVILQVLLWCESFGNQIAVESWE